MAMNELWDSLINSCLQKTIIILMIQENDFQCQHYKHMIVILMIHINSYKY